MPMGRAKLPAAGAKPGHFVASLGVRRTNDRVRPHRAFIVRIVAFPLAIPAERDGGSRQRLSVRPEDLAFDAGGRLRQIERQARQRLPVVRLDFDCSVNALRPESAT